MTGLRRRGKIKTEAAWQKNRAAFPKKELRERLPKKIFRKAACLGAVLSGAALLAYPWLSEWVYENRAASEAAVYEKEAAELEDGEKDALLLEAQAYNKALSSAQVKLTDPFLYTGEELSAEYESILWFNESGVMGYVDIPKINVYLPIYHGTAAQTLLAGVGHLEGSSLPVGGEDTHCILTGHTGLNRAKLFTDLVNMEEGDVFYLHVLGETLAYEVCEISVTLPEEQEKLQIQKGEDLCTLITCIPYGSNTHRLLVTGRRTEYTGEGYEASAVEAPETKADSQWLISYKKALLAGVCVSAAAAGLLAVVPALQRRRREAGEADEKEADEKEADGAGAQKGGTP